MLQTVKKKKSKQKMALRSGSFRHGVIPAKSVDGNPVVVNGHYSQLFLCLITPTGPGSLPPALVAPLSVYHSDKGIPFTRNRNHPVLA